MGISLVKLKLDIKGNIPATLRRKTSLITNRGCDQMYVFSGTYKSIPFIVTLKDSKINEDQHNILREANSGDVFLIDFNRIRGLV